MDTITTTLKDSRVLAVDDQHLIREYYRSVLRSSVHDYDLVSGVDEALALLRGHRSYDLLILDHMLPGRTGLELLRLIRTGRAGERHDLPVVIVTGYASREMVDFGRQLEVDAIVAKPFSAEKITLALERALENERDLPPPEHFERVQLPKTPPRKSGRGRGAAVLLTSEEQMSFVPAVRSADAPTATQRLSIHDISAGARLAEDVMSSSGQLLVSANSKLDEDLVLRLRSLATKGVCGEFFRVFAG